jgi:hypothetical protein
MSKLDEISEKLWNEFWKDIVTNEDGTINMEQLKLELSDFHFIMGEASKVYYGVTGGRMSKPTYFANDVISVSNDYHYESYHDSVKDIIMTKGATHSEKLDEIIDFFNINIEDENTEDRKES